jgi:hypothetical protein
VCVRERELCVCVCLCLYVFFFLMFAVYVTQHRSFEFARAQTCTRELQLSAYIHSPCTYMYTGGSYMLLCMHAQGQPHTRVHVRARTSAPCRQDKQTHDGYIPGRRCTSKVPSSCVKSYTPSRFSAATILPSLVLSSQRHPSNFARNKPRANSVELHGTHSSGPERALSAVFSIQYSVCRVETRIHE